MPTLCHAQSPEDAIRLDELADCCWRNHYIPIIGEAQVDYMLATFQSPKAISDQIADGRHYFFIEDETSVIHGYLACDENETHLFLSKLYILPNSQGRGFGKWAIGQLSKLHPGRDIQLTVNKHNHQAIAFYQTCGFEITDAIVTDIGHGFVMDDWIMVRKITEE